VVKDFAKAHEKLVAKLVSLVGSMPGAELEKVASLPTREQALSMLLGVLKAPIQNSWRRSQSAGETRPHPCRDTRPETGRGA